MFLHSIVRDNSFNSCYQLLCSVSELERESSLLLLRWASHCEFSQLFCLRVCSGGGVENTLRTELKTLPFIPSIIRNNSLNSRYQLLCSVSELERELTPVASAGFAPWVFPAFSSPCVQWRGSRKRFANWAQKPSFRSFVLPFLKPASFRGLFPHGPYTFAN